MRRRRVELEQAVIVAARRWAHRGSPEESQEGDLIGAVFALEDHDAAEMTGEGAKWVHGSPETSREAAGLAAPIQGSMRHRIVKALSASQPGCTDERLEVILGGKHQTVSSARNWLVEAGWARDSGYRQQTRSKREAVVWELTPAGHRQIGDL